MKLYRLINREVMLNKIVSFSYRNVNIFYQSYLIILKFIPNPSKIFWTKTEILSSYFFDAPRKLRCQKI